jgi:hypothetical protein
MLCLAGTFPIQGTEPDGDSVRFRPANPADWSKVPGSHQVHTNATGAAQLRADAIDALETHYAPPGGHSLHQPIGLADAAAAELLDWLGFTGVVRDGEKVTAVDDDGQPGFILTRGADKYGRCVALIGRGDPPVPNAQNVHVGLDLLRETANHHLISTGLAYPTYKRTSTSSCARSSPTRWRPHGRRARASSPTTARRRASRSSRWRR